MSTADPSDSSADEPQTLLGAIIRRQRELAELPMRKLAATVGISNPYLSQIERGLRAPSDAVLAAIAETLKLSPDQIFSDAGFVVQAEDERVDEEDPVIAAVAAATRLTAAQRRSLSEIYRAFLDANTVRRSRNRRST